MTKYLLDTDILSYLMRHRFPQVQARFAQTQAGQCAVSAITAAEILFGLESLAPFHPARVRALAFLDSVRILDWPADAAGVYAGVRYRARRQPLGERDMMIAAHAIAIDSTLVTNNTKHFSRVGHPLQLENWLW